jgi:prefoldin alpha subunit
MDQELMFKIQETNQKSQGMEDQTKVVDQQIRELQGFSLAIDELQNSGEKEILASIGKGVYIKSDMKEKDLFVDVGVGIFVKKDFDETKRVVENQLGRLQELRMQLSIEMNSLNSEVEKLIEEFQRKNK